VVRSLSACGGHGAQRLEERELPGTAAGDRGEAEAERDALRGVAVVLAGQPDPGPQDRGEGFGDVAAHGGVGRAAGKPVAQALEPRLARVPGVDYTLLGMGVAVILVVVAASASISRRETERRQIRRLALVERKLDAVLDHLGVEVSEPHLQRVEALLGQGKTIQAIKAYREATGADLREAKEVVDRLSERG
jgi:ribosomal protein L7/L12